MSDVISTDRRLTGPQRAVLDALLDTLLPASEDGVMPSAAQVDFNAYLSMQAEDFIPELISTLQHFDVSFAGLSLAERCQRVSDFSTANPEQFQSLLMHVYDCYYQNDRVRAQIGVVAGAPFPQGHQVTPGDLSLLDPVIENSARHRYRKV